VRSAVVFALTLGACYVPMLAAGPGSDGAGLGTFASDWEFNSTGFAVLAALGGDRARLAAPVLTALLIAIVWWRHRREPIERFGAMLYGVVFLCSPVVNPWYLIWVLFFTALRPSAWGVSAALIVPVAYAHGLNVDGLAGPYEHAAWVRPLEVAVVAGGLTLDGLRFRKRGAVQPGSHSPHSTPSAVRCSVPPALEPR
jgi:hypothetical protein